MGQGLVVELLCDGDDAPALPELPEPYGQDKVDEAYTILKVGLSQGNVSIRSKGDMEAAGLEAELHELVRVDPAGWWYFPLV